MGTITEVQIERWRIRGKEASANTDWISECKKTNVQRSTVRKEMLDFLCTFLSGETDIGEFQTTFDRRTRTDWDVFGLKGLSGAMFLNILVKHIPDLQQVTKQLKSVLQVPKDIKMARQRMQSFLDFLEDLIELGKAKRRVIQPARMPFFVSAWWHLQDTEQWPIFYISARKVLEQEGLYISSQNPVEDYLTFRECFLSLASALGLIAWDLEHLLYWYEKSNKPPSPEGVKEEDEEGEDEDRIDMNHTQIQWLLAKIGRRLGCNVWIASNDQSKEWKGEKLGDLSLNSLPSLGMDTESQNVIRLIDVLWIKGTKQVAAAFEIEYTTSVYSGLLRMSDLIALSPNLNFPLYIVVPKDRLDKVRRELSRPTFQVLDLHSRCGFFSFEELNTNADAIMEWGSDPAAINRLASKVDDTDIGE